MFMSTPFFYSLSSDLKLLFLVTNIGLLLFILLSVFISEYITGKEYYQKIVNILKERDIIGN